MAGRDRRRRRDVCVRHVRWPLYPRARARRWPINCAPLAFSYLTGYRASARPPTELIRATDMYAIYVTFANHGLNVAAAR